MLRSSKRFVVLGISSMNRVKDRKKQRHMTPLLFPMKFFKEMTKSFKYIYKTLTMSMRRKIAFDYGVLFVVVSVMTTMIVSGGFTLYEVKSEADEALAVAYEMASTKEMGFYNKEELERQLSRYAEEMGIGISIEMESDVAEIEPYLVSAIGSKEMDAELFDLSFPLLVNRFFTKGQFLRSEQRDFNLETDQVVTYTIKIGQSIKASGNELRFLIMLIFIAQVVGLTVISLVSSYRLKRVFRPVYTMTRTAEKISINDMNARLDVSKAEYELKDLALTFNDMLDRIRMDYDKQKRFVSDVSHELRTPISIVNGYARMLERWGKDDEAILKESIEAIKGESKNMQILVENLLLLVRSDNSTLKFEREYFQLDEMAQEIVNDMAMIDEGRHCFIKQIENDVQVCLDYSKVKQTLRIFLDNAIKYTPEGGTITLLVKKEGQELLISIIDTGIGVAKKDLPFLFDRFYRSDASRTRVTGGHGLGLSIAKAMVIGQKGRLKVKSKENEGSEFVIILPLVMGE